MAAIPGDCLRAVFAFALPGLKVIAWVCRSWRAAAGPLASPGWLLAPPDYDAAEGEWYTASVDLLEWTTYRRCRRPADLCARMAGIGALDGLQWARAAGCPWDSRVCGAAARWGHLAVLRWAVDEGCPMLDSRGRNTPVRAAAFAGRIAVLEYFGELEGFGPAGFAISPDIAAKSAAGGQLEALRWLCAAGCPWSPRVCYAAALGGHLAILGWARENGHPRNDDMAVARAAYAGQIGALQWLRGDGCPLTANACVFAAKGGQLAALQWLRAEGCPWDRRVRIEAAAGPAPGYAAALTVIGRAFDHAAVLEWARANNCPE